MSAKRKMTQIAQPVPELPVADVEHAQQHYAFICVVLVGYSSVEFLWVIHRPDDQSQPFPRLAFGCCCALRVAPGAREIETPGFGGRDLANDWEPNDPPS